MSLGKETWNFHHKKNFSFPTDMTLAPNAIADLGEYLKKNDVHAPLIVADNVVANLPFFKKMLNDLLQHCSKVQTFHDIAKNPVKSNVEKGAAVFRQSKCDGIVGIGGGASLDVARAIALAAYHPRDLFDYEDGKGDHLITEKIPHFVTIPTTAGTGSEVGRSAIISDDKTKQKKILFSPRLMAKKVFLDPMLTQDLPPAIAAATGMDALIHNLEAYLVQTFHPLCDGLALEGLFLIKNNLERVVLDPDLESRSKMLVASSMGAMSFQKGLGSVHSMAHALSSLLDMHHGLANALCLPYVIALNEKVVPEKIENVKRIFGTKDLVQYFHDLNRRIGLPGSLREAGVKEEDLPELAELALQDFCHPTNPHPMTKALFLNLFQEAYSK
jgi:alcohol dehydrogenase class IV